MEEKEVYSCQFTVDSNGKNQRQEFNTEVTENTEGHREERRSGEARKRKREKEKKITQRRRGR
jgi:hypothetical protein